MVLPDDAVTCTLVEPRVRLSFGDIEKLNGEEDTATLAVRMTSGCFLRWRVFFVDGGVNPLDEVLLNIEELSGSIFFDTKNSFSSHYGSFFTFALRDEWIQQ